MLFILKCPRGIKGDGETYERKEEPEVCTVPHRREQKKEKGGENELETD